MWDEWVIVGHSGSTEQKEKKWTLTACRCGTCCGHGFSGLSQNFPKGNTTGNPLRIVLLGKNNRGFWTCLLQAIHWEFPSEISENSGMIFQHQIIVRSSPVNSTNYWIATRGRRLVASVEFKPLTGCISIYLSIDRSINRSIDMYISMYMYIYMLFTRTCIQSYIPLRSFTIPHPNPSLLVRRLGLEGSRGLEAHGRPSLVCGWLRNPCTKRVEPPKK